jgi:hypothetical protein
MKLNMKNEGIYSVYVSEHMIYVIEKSSKYYYEMKRINVSISMWREGNGFNDHLSFKRRNIAL